MPGAVIFDFDGVIADSEMLHLRAFNKVLGGCGVAISKADYYGDYLGLTDIDLFKLLAERGILKADAGPIEELAEKKTRLFEELARSESTIIEGVADFLQMLRDNDVRMAICSGALRGEIEMVLERAGLREFFEIIVSAEQVERGKPEPDGFVMALKKLNDKGSEPLSAGQCVVIEDSHWGLLAARAAGMHTVAVTNSYDAEQLSMAEKIVTHLCELTMAELREFWR